MDGILGTSAGHRNVYPWFFYVQEESNGFQNGICVIQWAITSRKISTARTWWKGFLGRGVEKVEEGVGGINGNGKK